MGRCASCRVAEECADPHATCERCDVRRTVDRYPEAAQLWMATMLDLYTRQEAGWVIANDDLSLDDWRVLSAIRRWYRLKDLETQRLTMFG